MCCTNGLVECPIDRPNTGNQHKTSPLGRGASENPIQLFRWASGFRFHETMTLDGLPGPSAQRKPLMKSKKDKLPYLVDPDHLRALQIDPDVYLKSSPVGGWVAWMLDRKKDAALIERLQSMREPHGTVQ